MGNQNEKNINRDLNDGYMKFKEGDVVFKNGNPDYVKEVKYICEEGFRFQGSDTLHEWSDAWRFHLIQQKKKTEELLEYQKPRILYRDPQTFVDVEVKNQTFSDALANLKVGWGIKVPEWKGYWFLSGGEIWVRLEDGSKSNTPWYHQNVLREDWQSGPIKVVEMSKEELEIMRKMYSNDK